MGSYVEGEAPETDSEEEQYMFNLSYMKIGNENSIENNKTKDILLKGKVVDGVTEAEGLMNTPIATEITEEFTPIYPLREPTCPAEFFYENELLRKKINEVSTSILTDFIQSTMAPMSKHLIDTDSSLINTQLTLQNVATTVRDLSERSKKINSKMNVLIDSNFLPDLKRQPEKIPKPST